MSWIAWIYPKSWYRANEINRINREKLKSSLSVGRCFGKSGFPYHSIVESLPISDEKKKELHELYERMLRGEE